MKEPQQAQDYHPGILLLVGVKGSPHFSLHKQMLSRVLETEPRLFKNIDSISDPIRFFFIHNKRVIC